MNVEDPPFLCFDTEDNSKELGLMGADMFTKAVTQIAAITAGGERWYAGCPVKPPECWQRVFAKTFQPPTDSERKQIIAYLDIQREHSPKIQKAFLTYAKRAKERFIYCLNLQYDLGNLFADELDTLDMTLVGGRLIKAIWGPKIYVDVFNIWPMSVKAIGGAFGLEKLETGSMATDAEYVYRDVEIIRQAMLFAWQFTTHLQIDTLPPTLGGLCVKVWKSFGGKNCHDSSELSKLALYGGRVELFKKHNDCGKVGYVDINSLYPAMMLREYPGPLEIWTEPRLPKFGIVECTLKMPKMDLCPLPFRDDDGRILYPYGVLSGVWTVLEVQAALSAGAELIKVHQCLGTDTGISPYVQFVKRLYQARLESNSDAEKLFFKLLMNNLYGRLGTSGKIGRTVWQTEKNKDDGIPYGAKVLVTYAMPLPEETNWSHAAYVTAYGRQELLRYMRIIGAENMIYCDTDSCIFDCASGVLPFETGSELGLMKIEKMCGNCKKGYSKKCCEAPAPIDFWEGCETYAPKMYKAGRTYKAKGVPKHLAQEFILTGKAQFDLPYKLRESIKFYDRDNARKLSVWHTVEKHARTVYDKKILKDNRYYPLQIRGA